MEKITTWRSYFPRNCPLAPSLGYQYVISGDSRPWGHGAFSTLGIPEATSSIPGRRGLQYVIVSGDCGPWGHQGLLYSWDCRSHFQPNLSWGKLVDAWYVGSLILLEPECQRIHLLGKNSFRMWVGRGRRTHSVILNRNKWLTPLPPYPKNKGTGNEKIKARLLQVVVWNKILKPKI